MRTPAGKPNNINVDDRIPLRNYYRVADNFLKQADIYREEKNIVDLYVTLLKYSSLILETIRFHSDYQLLCSKERANTKKQLHLVLNELEFLKAAVDHQLVAGLNKCHIRSKEYQPNGHGGIPHRSGDSSSLLPAVNITISFGSDDKQLHQKESALSWLQNLRCTLRCCLF